MRAAVTMHFLTSSFPRTILLLLLAMLVAAPAMAQDASTASSAAAMHSSYGTEPPLSVRSAPAASLAVPAPAAAPREVEDSPPTRIHRGVGVEAKASKSHKFFPGRRSTRRFPRLHRAILRHAADDLARINKLHEDEELDVGQILKIPNPFEASNRNLEAQVQPLSDQNRTAQAKIDQVQAQASTLSIGFGIDRAECDAERCGEGPAWWRGTALAVGAAALLMLGVTALTLFEWWMLRRRFLALSDLAMSLSRLDVKYKETSRRPSCACTVLRTPPPGGRARESARRSEDAR